MNQQYYLLSQTASGLLVLGIRGQNKCLRRTVAEILADPRIMQGLPGEDKALIQSIAATDCNQSTKRRRTPHKKSEELNFKERLHLV